MNDTRFDRLAKGWARRIDRRRALLGAAGAAAAATGGAPAGAATFDSDCRRFIIAGGDDPKKKLRHVDDDLKIEVRSGSKRKQWKSVFFDNDGAVNVNMKPLKPIKFKARVGDQIRITAYNRQPPGCELDELWLFCKGSNRGKKISDRITPDKCSGDEIGAFLTKMIRIK
ncbi:MAG: hypothetical protein IT337_17195 [Thermomicrobiales bacterium]|nr:hypothetical protein [Thermomicrobiales bacterium]